MLTVPAGGTSVQMQLPTGDYAVNTFPSFAEVVVSDGQTAVLLTSVPLGILATPSYMRFESGNVAAISPGGLAATVHLTPLSYEAASR